MKPSAILRSCAGAALVVLAPCALAAHPLVTDDTGTQGQGNSQLEFNTDRFRVDMQRTRVAALTVTHGVADTLDVFVNLPRGLSSPRGAGDASFGAKWRLWDDDRASIAFKPEILLPTGNEAEGLGNGRAGMALALLASHEAGAWQWHANIGLAANRYRLAADREAKRRTLWRASAAVGYAVHPKWTVVADAGVARNPDTSMRTHPAFLLLGVIYAPNDMLDLDVGVKAGLNSAEVHRQLGVGITLRF